MTRMVVLAGFLVSFAAGLMVGWGTDEGPKPGPGGPGGPGPGGRGDRGSFLARELQLTEEQRKQMDEIWSETARRGGPRDGYDQRQQLRRQRDEAIVALIPAERRADYDRILTEHTAANEALEAQWKQRFQQAVERTRAILTPPQQEKYDSLLKRQGWDGRDRDRGDRGERGRPPPPPPGPPSTQSMP
jgi:Spy/CpxP family protein refolding chaperone